MDTKPYKLSVRRNTFPVRLTIDGQQIDATVKRLTLAEHSAFSRGFARINDPHSRRLVSMRMPGEEQDRREEVVGEDVAATVRRFAAAVRAVSDEDEGHPQHAAISEMFGQWTALAAADRARGPFVIPDAEIRRRRLVEMTPEARAEFDQLEEAEEAEARAFVEESLTAYFRVAPRQIAIEDEDGGPDVEVREGADFVRIYGARQDVLFNAMTLIATENTLGDQRKNASSSRPDSQHSSDAREQQDKTTSSSDGAAANADAGLSVSSATVTGSSEATPSGTTAPATT